jgi:hypothetical protein
MLDSSSRVISPGGFLISFGVQQRRKSGRSNIRRVVAVSDAFLRKELVSVRVFHLRNHKNILIKLDVGLLPEKFSENFN